MAKRKTKRKAKTSAKKAPEQQSETESPARKPAAGSRNYRILQGKHSRFEGDTSVLYRTGDTITLTDSEAESFATGRIEPA